MIAPTSAMRLTSFGKCSAPWVRFSTIMVRVQAMHPRVHLCPRLVTVKLVSHPLVLQFAHNRRVWLRTGIVAEQVWH